MAKNTIQLEIRGDDKASAVIKRLADQFDKSSDDITRDGKKAQAAWNNFTGAMKKGETAISNTVRKLGSLQGMLVMLAGGYGLKRVAESALDVAASFEQMELKLDALTKGRGQETLEELNQWALEMPVNTRKAVDAFTLMMAMGLKPTTKELGILVDVATLFGEEAMPRVARALGQMQQLGKLSAEELNQLAEVGINARGYVQDAFGTTVEEIQKMGVAIEDIIGVIWRGLEEDFGGAARKGMETWQGLTATFTSYVEEIERQVMGAGVFQELKEQLTGINEQLKEWLTINEDMIRQKVPEYIENIKGKIEGIWNWLQENTDVMQFGIIGLALVGIKGAAVGVLLGKYTQWLDETFGTVGQHVRVLEAQIDTLQQYARTLIKTGEATPEKLAQVVEEIKRINEEIEKWRTGQLKIGDDIGVLLQAWKKGEIETKNFLKELKVSTHGLMGNVAEITKEFREWPVAIKGADKEVKDFTKTVEDITKDKAWKERAKRAQEQVKAELEAIEEGKRQEVLIVIETNEEIIKEGEKAQKEIERAQKQMIKRLDREWEQFGERMYNTLSDSIYLFIEKGLDSFEDMWDLIVDYGKKTLANLIAWIANQKIVMPIMAQIVGSMGGYVPAGMMQAAGLPGGVGGMPGGMGGIGQYIPGVSNFLSTPMWGEAAMWDAAEIYGAMPSVGPTWGATLGAGAIGAMGYPILADLTGLPQGQLSSPLAGIGAGAGMLIGGPPGAIIGGMAGGLLGGVLGGDKEPKGYVDYSLIADLMKGAYSEAIFSGWPQELQQLAAQTFDPMLQQFSAITQEMKAMGDLTEGQISQLSDMILLMGEGEIYIHDLMKGTPGLIQQQAEAFKESFLEIMGAETIEELERMIKSSRMEEVLHAIIDPPIMTIAKAVEQLTEAYKEQAKVANELGVSLDLVREAYEAEMTRLTVGPYEALKKQVEGYQLGLERQAWGSGDWVAHYQGLTEELQNLDRTSETYYEDSLKLFAEQYQVLQIIERLMGENVGGLSVVDGTLEKMIDELTTGNLAPVQSAGAYQLRYSELMEGLRTAIDPDVARMFASELQRYLPEYLQFYETFGMDYKDLTGQVVGDLRELQGLTVDTATSTDGLIMDSNSLLADIISRLDEQITLMTGEIQGDAESLAEQRESTLLINQALEAYKDLSDKFDKLPSPELSPNVNEITPQMISPGIDVMGSQIGEKWGHPDFPGWEWKWDDWTRHSGRWLSPEQVKTMSFFQSGGIATGPFVVGEKGEELLFPMSPTLVMPTYEPEQSQLLSRMGIDPTKIAVNMARYISESGAGNREVVINLNAVIEVDGRVVGNVVADQTRVNIELIEGIRKAVH